MAKLTVPLASVIKVERNPALTADRWKQAPQDRAPLNIPTFPEFIRDSDGKYLALVHDGKRIDDPLLAYCVALVKYGYENHIDWYSLPKNGKFNPPLEGPAGNYPQPSHSLTDVCVIREDKWRGKHMNFPMLLGGNRGLRGVYLAPEPDGNGVLACYISMIQQGIRLKHYDNSLESALWDDTAEHVAYLTSVVKGDISFPKVVKDSGWALNEGSSMPHRGIQDFDRDVEFSGPLSTEQMLIVRDLLQNGAFFDEEGNVVESACPGWTGVMDRAQGHGRYRFCTTWDSSD